MDVCGPHDSFCKATPGPGWGKSGACLGPAWGLPRASLKWGPTVARGQSQLAARPLQATTGGTTGGTAAGEGASGGMTVPEIWGKAGARRAPLCGQSGASLGPVWGQSGQTSWATQSWGQSGGSLASLGAV